MSTSMRPREIQDRIRAGESTEDVAQAAGTTVEAIMPYVAPVIAERGHIAERAQKASLRRAAGDGAPAQVRGLGDAVAAHLHSIGADVSAITWDSYRRETGRWVLTAVFDLPGRSGTGRFTFDAPGNYALCDNDEARWLVGDVVAIPEVAAPRDDLQQARERRLQAVTGDELPLGDLSAVVDAIAETPAEVQAPPTAPAPPAPAAQAPRLPAETEVTAPTGAAPDAPAAADAPDAPDAPNAPAAATSDEDADDDSGRHRRPVQKKRGRASVPSWDEIMFGGGDQ